MQSNKNIKIKYVANIRIPTEKAHGVQIMNMCKAFSEGGADLNLIVPRRLNDTNESPFSYYDIEETFKITKVPTIDLGSSWLGYWIQTLSFSLFCLVYMIFNNTGVIYSRDDVPLRFLSLISKDLFYEVHTNRFNSMVAKTMSKMRGLVHISGGLKIFFEGKGVKTVSMVAHDAVDLNLFDGITESKSDLRAELDLPASKTIVGYVGKYTTMGKEKGVDTLIRSFSEVRKDNPNTFLLIVGLGSGEKEKVNDLMKDLNIDEGSYRLITHIKHHKAMRCLKAMDMVVMNYPNTEHYANYMSPLKLFEYMASGNAIITSDLPSIREVLAEDEAKFIDPDEEGALTAAIRDLISREEDVETLGQAAYEKAESYTWRKRAEEIVNFIGPLF